MQYILIAGNPVDGHGFYGPFDTARDAADGALDMRIDEWWVAELTAPFIYGEQ